MHFFYPPHRLLDHCSRIWALFTKLFMYSVYFCGVDRHLMGQFCLVVFGSCYCFILDCSIGFCTLHLPIFLLENCFRYITHSGIKVESLLFFVLCLVKYSYNSWKFECRVSTYSYYAPFMAECDTSILHKYSKKKINPCDGKKMILKYCVLLEQYGNLLKTKRNLLYIRNPVPHCKHFPPQL